MGDYININIKTAEVEKLKNELISLSRSDENKKIFGSMFFGDKYSKLAINYFGAKYSKFAINYKIGYDYITITGSDEYIDAELAKKLSEKFQCLTVYTENIDGDYYNMESFENNDKISVIRSNIKNDEDNIKIFCDKMELTPEEENTFRELLETGDAFDAFMEMATILPIGITKNHNFSNNKEIVSEWEKSGTKIEYIY